MHWTWNYPWDPLTTWMVVAIGGVLFLGSYLLVRRQIFPLRISTLAILLFRASAFVLIVFFLLQPRVFVTRTDEVPPHVAVLIDTSQSMSVVDAGGRGPRIQEAASLVRDSKLVSKLGKKTRLHFYEFSGGLLEVPPDKVGQLSKAEGTSTGIGLAITQVQNEFKGEDMAGIILLSDGRSNSGSDPAEAARQAKSPIFTVCVGRRKKEEERTKEQDIAIVRVAHDQRVVVGHATDITVTVSARGFEPRTFPVELKLDDQVVTKSSIVLSPDRPERQITLKLIPPEPGQFVYTVKVPEDPAEKNKGNNEKSVPIYVTDPVARVLYVEAQPRWEFKFLSRVLSGYKNILHTSVVKMSADKTVVQGSDPSDSAQVATLAPAQIRRLKALIIGDVPRSFFTDEQSEAVVSFVEQGGAIMLLGGRQSLGTEGFGQSPIAKVLPVDLTEEPAYTEDPVAVELTPEGKAHPAFQNVQYDWTRAPNLISLVRTGPPKPGATTLIRTAGGSNLPVVVLQRYGKGKVALLLSDSTWKWKLGMAEGTVETDLHTVFWRQIINWLMPDQQERKETRAVQLIANKLSYEMNETVSLTVTPLDQEGKIADQAKVRCVIYAPDGKVIEKAAVFGKIGEPGSLQTEGFLASFSAHVSGKYKVVASAHIAGASLGRDEVAFVVGDVSMEMSETDPDPDLLKELAELGHGKYYNASDFPKLITDMTIDPKKNTWTEKRDIWNEWKFFLILIALLSAEWAIRKGRQLE